MGFSNQERINLNSKVLAARVKDANELTQWYESRFFAEFVINANKVWTQLNVVENFPAGNLATAQSNAAGPLAGIIDDISLAPNAIRLSAIPGTNGSTYVAYSTFNDFSSPILDNWLQPQQVPQSNGAPSIGYAIRLFEGDPNLGGVEILTTDGTTGTGVNKTVGWVFDYGLGQLLLSADFRASVTDPYILGFRYIGTTAQDGYSTLSGDVTGQSNNNIIKTITGSSGLVTVLANTFEFAQGVVNPKINQQSASSGDGYDLVIGSQSSLGGNGGNVSLVPGSGTVNDGYVDVNNSFISNLLDPVLPQDAATKNYVDTNSGSDFEGTVTTSGLVTSTVATFTIPLESVGTVEAKISGWDTLNGTGAGFTIIGVFKNDGGTVSQIGNTGVIFFERENATYDATFVVSSPNITIDVTGATLSTIDWKAEGNITLNS